MQTWRDVMKDTKAYKPQAAGKGNWCSWNQSAGVTGRLGSRQHLTLPPGQNLQWAVTWVREHALHLPQSLGVNCLHWFKHAEPWVGCAVPSIVQAFIKSLLFCFSSIPLQCLLIVQDVQALCCESRAFTFAFSTCAGLLRDSNVGIRRLDFVVTQNWLSNIVVSDSSQLCDFGQVN